MRCVKKVLKIEFAVLQSDSLVLVSAMPRAFYGVPCEALFTQWAQLVKHQRGKFLCVMREMDEIVHTDSFESPVVNLQKKLLLLLKSVGTFMFCNWCSWNQRNAFWKEAQSLHQRNKTEHLQLKMSLRRITPWPKVVEISFCCWGVETVWTTETHCPTLSFHSFFPFPLICLLWCWYGGIRQRPWIIDVSG